MEMMKVKVDSAASVQSYIKKKDHVPKEKQQEINAQRSNAS